MIGAAGRYWSRSPSRSHCHDGSPARLGCPAAARSTTGKPARHAVRPSTEATRRSTARPSSPALPADDALALRDLEGGGGGTRDRRHRRPRAARHPPAHAEVEGAGDCHAGAGGLVGVGDRGGLRERAAKVAAGHRGAIAEVPPKRRRPRLNLDGHAEGADGLGQRSAVVALIPVPGRQPDQRAGGVDAKPPSRHREPITRRQGELHGVHGRTGQCGVAAWAEPQEAHVHKRAALDREQAHVSWLAHIRAAVKFADTGQGVLARRPAPPAPTAAYRAAGPGGAGVDLDRDAVGVDPDGDGALPLVRKRRAGLEQQQPDDQARQDGASAGCHGALSSMISTTFQVPPRNLKLRCSLNRSLGSGSAGLPVVGSSTTLWLTPWSATTPSGALTSSTLGWCCTLMRTGWCLAFCSATSDRTVRSAFPANAVDSRLASRRRSASAYTCQERVKAASSVADGERVVCGVVGSTAEVVGPAAAVVLGVVVVSPWQPGSSAATTAKASRRRSVAIGSGSLWLGLGDAGPRPGERADRKLH